MSRDKRIAVPRFDPPPPEDHPELFFALVGPSGCDLDSVVRALKGELATVNYRTKKEIRLARMLHRLKIYEHLARIKKEDERLKMHMDAGDNVRRELGHRGAVAALALVRVGELRHGEVPKRAMAYIFRSLKHPEEVKLLRSVYGPALFVISVYDSKENRTKNLARKIEKSWGKKSGALEAAIDLIGRDEKGKEEDRDDYGQNVRGTFPLADFFVRSGVDVRGQIKKLIQALFEHPFESPSKDEHAMYLAQVAALRSADLSRQVGAVVVDGEAEVLATGCNEVPKFGGGIYCEGDNPDGRDWPRGEDPNAIMRREILSEVFAEIRRGQWLAKDLDQMSPAELTAAALEQRMFSGTRIAELVEFGRVVHAEMNAITSAARRGIPLSGSRLFCTTFPCHVCARHILASGISEVVYIEPYPKSLAADLYEEAITVGDDPVEGKLMFRPFVGVAPRRYGEMFQFGKRKNDDGYAREWIPEQAKPRTSQFPQQHLLIEKDWCRKLKDALVKRGWLDESKDDT